MSVASYGNKRAADVSIDDIDVFYTYVVDRNTLNTNLKATSIDATTVLSQVQHPLYNDILGGMYNLTLPASIFNAVGIYNILIKPKEIRTVIADVGVLSSRPDITGLVLDTSDPTLANYSSILNDDGLNGYRIEYIDTTTGTLTPNLFRIVTSSNRCEPITENLTNTNQKSIRYRFNDASSLLFLTLTPSSASNIKPTSTPFIGVAGQQINIYNTYFDPIMLEIEMVNDTVETIADFLKGDQAESVDGKLTIYTNDANKNIAYQANIVDILDTYGNTLIKVRQQVSVIDDSYDYSVITNDLNS